MQIPLDFSARARRTDSQPSIDGARKVDAAALESLILDTLIVYGPRTTAELAQLTCRPLVSVSPRMIGLESRGKVARDGRRKNPSGVMATAWRAL